MSLMEADNFTMLHAGKCHVCHGPIREDQDAIEHSGEGVSYRTGGNYSECGVSIWMHPECAVVLGMRLMHDVMQIKSNKDKPMRVVSTLQSVSRINQVR